MGTGTTCAQNWGQAPAGVPVGVEYSSGSEACEQGKHSTEVGILIYYKKSLQCKSKLVEHNLHVADGIRWLFYSQVSSSMTPKVAVPVRVGIPLWLEKLVKNRLIRPYHK
jgi:hypothetical protein